METPKISISMDRDRSIYNRISKKPEYKGLLVSPSYLRIEQAVANGKQKYEFSITKDSNSDTVTEQKLDRNDKFEVTHLGIFLMKRCTTTATGQEILCTYPAEVIFADNSTTFIGSDLNVFYNGKLSFQVLQTKYIESLNTDRFRHVPATLEQAGAFYAISASGVEATSSVLAACTKQLKQGYAGATGLQGLLELTPQIQLDGNRKTTIALDVPVASGHKVAHTASVTTNYLVLKMQGYLVSSR